VTSAFSQELNAELRVLTYSRIGMCSRCLLRNWCSHSTEYLTQWNVKCDRTCLYLWMLMLIAPIGSSGHPHSWSARWTHVHGQPNCRGRRSWDCSTPVAWEEESFCQKSFFVLLSVRITYFREKVSENCKQIVLWIHCSADDNTIVW
jgi:hypothetical protein